MKVLQRSATELVYGAGTSAGSGTMRAELAGSGGRVAAVCAHAGAVWLAEGRTLRAIAPSGATTARRLPYVLHRLLPAGGTLFLVAEASAAATPHSAPPHSLASAARAEALAEYGVPRSPEARWACLAVHGVFDTPVEVPCDPCWVCTVSLASRGR